MLEKPIKSNISINNPNPNSGHANLADTIS